MESAVQINHSALAQHLDGVFHRIGVEVTHDKDIIVVEIITIVLIMAQQ